MDASQELTRHIYWSPLGELNKFLHTSTYFWLLVASAVFCWGVYKYVLVWRQGKPEVCFDRPIDRVVLFFRNVIGQARVLRSRREREPKKKSAYAGIMHGLIFYGFLALFFATTIVAFKEYGLMDVYHGWFYGFIKIMCQVAGVGLAVGLLMGIFRRSKKELKFKHELSYTVLYVLLFLLVVQGFVIQGHRLHIEPNAVDANFAFVGKLFSYLFPNNLSQQTEQNLYSVLWYFHMLTTMAFIASIPYSRAMHIVTATLNLYTQRLEPTVRLAKMDFENAESEYFGNREIKDFTWKDLLSFDTCTECRRCTDICPANAVDKPLDPREIILKLRDSMRVEAHMKKADAKAEDAYLFENGTITKEETWACTNCGGCVNECPVGIDQLRTIMQLRRYQTLSLGEIPTSAGKAVENIKQYSNPWGLPGADRFKWAEGLNVPVITGDSPEVEWLYYVGCAGSYDAPNQKVARSVVSIMQSAGVQFAVMGKAERCNGEPVKRLGDEYSFAEIANSNVEQLNKLKFKKIVTHCPHCFNTLKNDYPDYGGQYKVFHHTQLISELLKNKKLVLPTAVDKEVTFHDPCFLGRHNGEYDAPRQILEAVAGLRIREMEKSRETSSCCGMGGGNMWYESEGGGKIVENRLKHVAETGAKTLVTGCSFCLINFKSSFANVPETKDIEIIDIAQVVAAAQNQASP